MPIFEYRCADCDATFERLRTRAQAEAEEASGRAEDLICACGGARVERILFSRVAVGAGGGGDECAAVCAPAGT